MKKMKKMLAFLLAAVMILTTAEPAVMGLRLLNKGTEGKKDQ